MTKHLSKTILASLVLVPLALPLPSLASHYENDLTGQTLRNQREQINELNRQLQVQTNQREIERLQNQLSGNQNQNQNQPPVVVVEQRQPNVGTVLLGTVLGAALNNGYVNCGPHGNCSYGYGGYGGYRGGYGYGRTCSWGSGYRGCVHRKQQLTVNPPPISASGMAEQIRETEAGLNRLLPEEKELSQLEEVFNNTYVDCEHWDGSCSAGYRGLEW